MSQTTVTKHYNIKKRNINLSDVTKPLHNIVSNDGKLKTAVGKEVQNVNAISLPKPKKGTLKAKKSTVIERKQSTLSTFFAPESEKLNNAKSKTANEKIVSQQLESSDPKGEISFPCSPKRNLPSPSDEGTPSKRKHLEIEEILEKAQTAEKPKSNARRKLQLGSLPSKSRTVHSPNAKIASESPKPDHILNTKTNVASAKDVKAASKPKETARRKLQLDSPNTKLASASPRKSVLRVEESSISLIKGKIIDKPKEAAQRMVALDSILSKSKTGFQSPSKLMPVSPRKNLLRTPDKLDALIDQSRSTLLLSPKHDELKKALRLFSEKTSNPKDLQSSPYKTNVIPVSPKSIKKKTAFPTTVFASEPIKHLDTSDEFVLPHNYKVLSEMFRSMDALVGTLNNRREKISFDSVKEGVQKIMKRKFNEKHLGQIMTVLPSAYNLSREKASFMHKKNNSEYQLVITPNINAGEGDNKDPPAFQPMNVSCLTRRINEFNQNLLELVKKHHQEFLNRIHFAPVSVDSIRRWHPKFAIDSVPDVPVAKLPESHDMKIIYTALDVFNRLKESIQNKVGKALQSIADESAKSGVTLELKEITSSKKETTKKERKGICGDLLEKIRAKESAKLLKTMTRSPAEAKTLAMLERVPKIVQILHMYFLAERKAAIPVDSVVDKIIHSFISLLTPEVVEEHLNLISEKFPDWLNFIQRSKRVYITINKKTNITEMLDRAGFH